MGMVARELVEKAGIDVEELLGKLVAAAGAARETCFRRIMDLVVSHVTTSQKCG